VISKFRRERMEAIAQEMNKYHIVALQEVCTPHTEHGVHIFQCRYGVKMTLK